MNRLQRKCLNSLSEFVLGLILMFFLAATLQSEPSFAQGDNLTQTTSQLNIFQAIILGMVQGLTEFLPISSSAHLKVIPVILGWGDPGVAFTAVIQLGSIAAVLWYFWGDLKQITTGMIQAITQKNYQSQEFRLALGIALGTIPIMVGGLLLKIFVPDYDNSPLRSMPSIAIASIIMSLLLGVTEFIGTHKRDFTDLTVKDGILMGCAQALALIPGVSRSGSTITAGLFMGLTRATAARFSFLLGIPAISITGLVELKEIFKADADIDVVTMIVGIISAAIFSYLAIAWLIDYLKNKSTWIFVWYRLVFGVIILLAVAFKVLNP